MINALHVSARARDPHQIFQPFLRHGCKQRISHRSITDERKPDDRAHGRRLSQEMGESANQRQLVLDRLQAPNRADDHDVLTVESRRHDADRLGIRGRKSLGIDTVIDLSYPRGGHADLGDEKASKILRYRGVTMNQRAVEPAQNARPEPAAIQIAYVPTMLAVDPDRNATGPCRNEGIES